MSLIHSTTVPIYYYFFATYVQMIFILRNRSMKAVLQITFLALKKFQLPLDQLLKEV